MKHAVVILVMKDNKVLGVSRKDDPSAFGLPGGKVDDGETLEQAARRELLEETGLIATSLRCVYVAPEKEFSTVAFEASVTGEISTTESGVVRWVEPEVLFSGPFGEYNTRLFTHLNIYKRQNRIVKETRVIMHHSGVRETQIILTPDAERSLQMNAKLPSTES